MASSSRVPWWPGLSTARDIAAAAGARSVGTQHVLLALVTRAEPDVAPVLRAGAIDRPAVLAALQGITGTGCRRESVRLDAVAVSPRVLALVREAATRGQRAGAVPDLDVLDALLAVEEPSLAALVLTALGSRRRVRTALRRHVQRADDGGGDLVGR
ncbi:hypothetical protein [Actinomycetospora termitidis]|uniref:Clp R domain-containing protein n=1 Tax=Actinomycetospora termitidis TaxID=3053470 RepID=A0ABT7MGB6_9PSEU|nr:hypothetical protein [Actinomycetospora sp. Odt1-22]MDL5159491.1 hypothetical protein [Actinomycetospora sp. Odt1-22]